MATCPECGSAFQPSDNYCRECGMYLASLRLPEPIDAGVPRSVAVPTERRPAIPSPALQLATAVAVGTALPIGLAVASRLWALRHLAAPLLRSAAARPRPPRVPAPDAKADGRSRVQDEDATIQVETLIIRRWWVRRS